MYNFKPVLALSIILLGFLISISVAFLNILGPNVPLPRKNIFEILKSPDNSPFLSAKENMSTKSKRKSAELYLNQESLVHGYSNLNFNNNLSDPKHGKFVFLLHCVLAAQKMIAFILIHILNLLIMEIPGKSDF